MFFYTLIFGLVLIFKITHSQFEIESNVNNNSNFLSIGLTYPLILNQYIHIFITEKNRIYFICLSISFFLLHLVFYARETSTQYGLIILEPTYSRNMFSK